jgi:hypothetical protein
MLDELVDVLLDKFFGGRRAMHALSLAPWDFLDAARRLVHSFPNPRATFRSNCARDTTEPDGSHDARGLAEIREAMTFGEIVCAIAGIAADNAISANRGNLRRVFRGSRWPGRECR